jgi:hypothetical protein
MGTKRIGLARVEALLENLKREISWSVPDGTAFGGCVKTVKLANTSAAVQNSDSEVTWTQPAGTVLNAIYLAFPVSPVFASGDFGFGVGTATGGGQIVTEQTDEIIDAGTTVVKGAVLHIAQRGKAADGSGGPILAAFNSATTDADALAADGTYTATARTLYFNTLLTNVSVTTAGTAVWIVEYMHIDAGDTEGA